MLKYLLFTYCLNISLLVILSINYAISQNKIISHSEIITRKTYNIIKHDTLLVSDEKYIGNYDTIIKGTYFDLKGEIIYSQENFYYKSKQVIKTQYPNSESSEIEIYLNDEYVPSLKIIDKKDSILLKYDIYNNILKEVHKIHDQQYGADSITHEFKYEYDSGGNMKLLRYFFNNNLVYIYKIEIDTIHNLKIKILQFYDLDEKAPIPFDIVKHYYSKNGNLIEEIGIIDNSIKQKYKDELFGYFNEVEVKKYIYDNDNRIVEKLFYFRNQDDSISIDSLINTSIFSKKILYVYSD